MKNTLFTKMTKKQESAYSETVISSLDLIGAFYKTASKRSFNKLVKLHRDRDWKSHLKTDKQAQSYLVSRLGKPLTGFFNSYYQNFLVWGFFYDEGEPVVIHYSYQDGPYIDIYLHPDCEIREAIGIMEELLAILKK